MCYLSNPVWLHSKDELYDGRKGEYESGAYKMELTWHGPFLTYHNSQVSYQL